MLSSRGSMTSSDMFKFTTLEVLQAYSLQVYPFLEMTGEEVCSGLCRRWLPGEQKSQGQLWALTSETALSPHPVSKASGLRS